MSSLSSRFVYPTNFSGDRGDIGFSLVELLIALTLSTWLLSSVGLTVQRLWLMARLSADEVELAERGDFALNHLSQALLNASPIRGQAADLSPCSVPKLQSQMRPDEEFGMGIRVLGQGEFGCLPSRSLVENSPLLVVEQTRSCHEGFCDQLDLSGDRQNHSQCYFGGLSLQPTVITQSRYQGLPQDCSGVASLPSWSRHLYYLRDFSWDSGDGVGALMMKTWRPESRTFGRGEVLVPGVVNWALKPIELPLSPSTLGDEYLVAGVDIRLTLWGRRAGLTYLAVDASTNLSNDNPNATLGYSVLSEHSGQRMTFSGLVLSRHLQRQQSSENQ